jgi:glycosyltransferase involved in cell wall biosynthesis
MIKQKVSVIIPVYNQAMYLRQSLASVAMQTYDAVETIVVDDGSTDDPETVCGDFGVKYMRQDNKGPAAALNKGLACATGVYFQRLDADDALMPDKIKKCVEALEGTCADGVYTDYFINNERDVTFRGKETPQVISFDSLACNLITPFPPHSLIVKMSSINNIRFDERLKYNPDWLFYITLAGYGLKFLRIPERLCVYNDRDGTASKNRLLAAHDRLLAYLIVRELFGHRLCRINGIIKGRYYKYALELFRNGNYLMSLNNFAKCAWHKWIQN